jgi:ribose-phosphate pyrophosphokinase
MNVAEVMHVIGDVKGRTCLIIDDIIDTAGTLVKTADALLAAGASKVFACASHPVLSGPAIERIAKSKLEQVVVTNTIPLTEAGKAEPKIKVLSIAGLLGRAIHTRGDFRQLTVCLKQKNRSAEAKKETENECTGRTS